VTFGKVAQPLLPTKIETDRRNKKKGLMKVMFYPNVNFLYLKPVVSVHLIIHATSYFSFKFNLPKRHN